MKYLAVLIIAFAAFAAADDEWKPVTSKEIAKKYFDDCKTEVGGPEKSNELTLCIVKKMGVFTEDKGYDLDRVIAQLGVFMEDPEKVRDIVAGCLDKNEQKSSAAEWAARVQHCLEDRKVTELLKERKSPLETEEK